MAAILGMRGSGNFTVSGQRPESWDEGILFKYGEIAPLTAMLTMLPKAKAVRDPKYHWFEEQFPPQRLRINNGAGYDNSTQVLTVDAESLTGSTPNAGAKQVRKGTVLWNERSGEKMYVNDDPVNDTQIICTRGYGTTAAAAINDDDWLTIIGNTHAEGTDVPTAVGYSPEEIENCTQIFRVPINLTGTAIYQDFRTGDAYKNARRRAARDYAIQKEMAYLFGEYYYTTNANGMRISTTRGLVPSLNSSNIKSDVGALDEATWDSYLEQLARENGLSRKVTLCGGTALRVIETMCKSGNIQMQSDPKNETYGLNIMKYVSSFGTIRFMEHPLFSKHPVLRKNMLIVDTEYVMEVPYKNRDTNVLKDRQAPGVDGKIDEIFGETGFKCKWADAHMYITGLTSFAP